MAHYPVDHPLRKPYRLIAAACGLYLTLVGVIGLALSWGDPFFARGGGVWSLGLRTNPAGAVLALVAGLVVLAAALVGGNLHHHVNLVAGWALMAVAMVILAVIQTDVNVVDASMVNVIVVSAVGLVVLTAALYGKVESPR